MKVGRELRKRRETMRLSLRALAKETGIGTTTLWRYEQGQHLLNMSLDHAKALALFFGLDLDEITQRMADEQKKEKCRAKPKTR